MTRFISKKECEYKKGFVTRNNEIIGLPVDVVFQLRRLEGAFQRARYLATQPAGRPAPSLDGFEFESEHKVDVPWIEHVDTPALDAKIDESLALISELEKMHMVGQVNQYRSSFRNLFEFVGNDEFIEASEPMRLDLATIGNPLTLTTDMLVGICDYIADVAEDLIGDFDGEF